MVLVRNLNLNLTVATFALADTHKIYEMFFMQNQKYEKP